MQSPLVKWFVYASVLFLGVALMRGELLVVPTVHSPGALWAATGLLCAAFLMESAPWRRMLRDAGIDASWGDSLGSIGISVFGKYMPGKLWAIVGRSAFIAARCGAAEKDATMVAVNAQVISLWTGLLLGALALLVLEPTAHMGWAALGLWLAMSLLLFTDGSRRIAVWAASRALGMTITLPRMSPRQVLVPGSWYLALWALWCAGYWLLVHALVGHGVPLFVGWSFALAATAGILALIAPGGIGVREGILGAYLMFAGLAPTEATTVAAASRLWFLVGETFIFGVALGLDRARSRLGRGESEQ